MKPKNTPYRHEVRSKLKTQVVRDRTIYNRDLSKEEFREMLEEERISKKDQREAIVELMRQDEEDGMYEIREGKHFTKTFKTDLKESIEEDADIIGNKEGENFIKAQSEYRG